MDLILRNHYIESREMCKEENIMGLADCFSAEDRVQVKFSTFYELVKGCTQRDMLMNGINCNVPHRYLREMFTGKSEEPEDKELLIGDGNNGGKENGKRHGK